MPRLLISSCFKVIFLPSLSTLRPSAAVNSAGACAWAPNAKASTAASSIEDWTDFISCGFRWLRSARGDADLSAHARFVVARDQAGEIEVAGAVEIPDQVFFLAG